MKTIYFDCFAGAAGDMLLASLLELGIDLIELENALASMELGRYRLHAKKVQKKGLAATSFQVEALEKQHFRHLPQITSIINNSALPTGVKEKSIDAFARLAKAEAHVHGVSMEKIHFHEVGALDTIIDICGFFWALDKLKIERVLASPLPAGRGWINSQHGPLPLPAPATMQLLAARKVPLVSSSLEKELVTPTGAALLCAAVESFGGFPAFTLEKVGCGAGNSDFPIPNLLRAHLGTVNAVSPYTRENAILLEANIDDLNPETYDYILERLFAQGAQDVYLNSIQMKKNRPAVKLSVLIKPEKLEEVSSIVFAETSSIGLRVTEVQKIMLPRKIIEVETRWGMVRVKVAGEKHPYVNAAPEYEDCRAIARKENLPLKEVYRQVEYAFREKPHLE